MSWFGRQIQRVIFSERPGDGTGRPSRYPRMWRNTVSMVAAVCIVPLVGVTSVNFLLYRRSFRNEITQPIQRISAITKRSLESFLEERIAAARYVVSREEPQDLFDPERLASIFSRMRESFGGLVDVGVIDADGVMRTYVGPYDLLGKEYRDQDWFSKMRVRELYVSDVFLGHRQSPHFVIAVKREDENGRPFIFRATIDTEGMVRQIRIAGLKQDSDAFLVNVDGLLQTPSRLFGPALEPYPAALPPFAEGAELFEEVEVGSRSYLMGYAYIEQSRFVFVILVSRHDLMKGWHAYETELLAVLVLSVLVTLVVIMAITSNWIARIREADQRREASIHAVEHTNRMASIGRLAAGVAHEINNPLAIINEKAGLMKDILGTLEVEPQHDRGQSGSSLTDGAPGRAADSARPIERNRRCSSAYIDDSAIEDEPKMRCGWDAETGRYSCAVPRLLGLADSVLRSVERCSEITHRLLGFARHMDVKNEPVAVDALIRDVLGFLVKEASYRDIHVEVKVSEPLPTIHSDKGKLQQLFLNLVNNAFDSMDNGGRLGIAVRRKPPDQVEVTITDDGCGINKADLERIFEPFFTTKSSKGTGLGLSISYGIVQELKGSISVRSEVGKGTSFTVVLPVARPA